MMRKPFFTVSMAVLSAAVLLAVPAPAASAPGESLYAQFRNAGAVRIYVDEPTDASKEKKADLKGLKAALEKALTERKSVRFAVQPSAEAAELRVRAEVTETLWQESDPVDMLIGAGAAAMDAAINEHFARIKAKVSVEDLKTGRVLWSDELKGSITSNDVTLDNYQVKLNERMGEVFVAAAFGKKRRS